MKRFLPAVLAALLLSGCGVVSGPSSSAAKGADMARAAGRVVQARIYEDKRLALTGRSVDDAAAAIAALRPTWVSGVVKLDRGNNLNVAQVAAYTRVQDVVKAQYPGCLFDFVLDADQYDGTTLAAKMKEINSALKVDAWYLEDLSKAYDKSPDTVKGAVEYAHSLGQSVGGEVSGKAPEGIDFAVADDDGGPDKVKGNAGKAAGAGGVPVLVRILSASAKQDKTPDFLAGDAAFRGSYLEKLAAGQAQGGFRLMYPVFYPLNADKSAYDAASDGTLQRISALLDQYNP